MLTEIEKYLRVLNDHMVEALVAFIVFYMVAVSLYYSVRWVWNKIKPKR